MAKIKLTGKRIQDAICDPSKFQTFVWDSETKGLALRITKTGSKAYIFESRFSGQTVRMTIGDIKVWQLSKAQEEARKFQTMIDEGTDPRQFKAEKKEKAKAVKQLEKIDSDRNSILVQYAWDEYVAKRKPRWGKHHALDHEKSAAAGGLPRKKMTGPSVQGVLYKILQMRLVDISAEVLSDWQIQENVTRPTSARHGFLMFRPFWRWCGTHAQYKAIIDPQAINAEVLQSVSKPEPKRYDVLQKSQLKDWFESVRAIANPVLSAYLQGLILTGCRRQELAEIRWEDVNFKAGSILVKDKVDAGGRMIPLNSYMRRLIVGLPRRNQFVFSGRPGAATGWIAGPTSGHNLALDRAGLDRITLHGLRRSFASLAEWVEMPAGVIAQIMGHKPSAIAEKHYIIRPLELLALWHGRYEAWILDQAGVEFEHDETLERLRVVK